MVVMGVHMGNLEKRNCDTAFMATMEGIGSWEDGLLCYLYA